MIQTIYLICTGISLISTCIYFIYNRDRINFSFAIIELLFILSNIGYFCLAASTSLSEALLANKITYIGSCVLPVILFLSIAHICNFKIHTIPKYLLGVYSAFVFAMSITPGYTDWYYKSAVMGKYHDATILIKEYGWSHDLFDVLLYGCLLFSVGILVYIILAKKNVSIRNVTILLIMEILSIGLYIISTLFVKDFEVTTIIYAMDSVGILLVSISSVSYNLEDSIITSLMEKKDYGYIIINKRGIYLGCNATAKDFLTELNETRIDKPIDASSKLKPIFDNWIEAFESGADIEPLNIDDRFLKCTIRYIYANGKINGYLLEIVDDTKQQEYIRLLDQVAKNKSDFLSNMSHEIRTPVNAILGMNEMILKECKDETILEYAEDIDSSGKLLSALINDILDFSKIESGKMKIVPVNYNLRSVISNLVKMIHVRLEKKNLQFVLDVDPLTPRMLNGDEIRIQQIVTNLLTNAVKYTEVGTVTLHVGYENIDENNINLVIKVEDTGKGIKEAEREKLFTAFERIDEEKNRNIEGTGLGLAITSRFVHLMKGAISVDSEYGKGSVFTIKLPQEIVKSEAGKLETIGNEDSIFKNIRNKNQVDNKSYKAPTASVLVVDDTEMNLKVVARFLKNTEIRTVLVKSAAEALEMVKTETFDIILMDHMMPEMDGIECLTVMKEQNLIGNTPVIALTANAVSDVDKQYLSKGFDDYMLKPFKAAELDNLILRHLPVEKVVEG